VEGPRVERREEKEKRRGKKKRRKGRKKPLMVLALGLDDRNQEGSHRRAQRSGRPLRAIRSGALITCWLTDQRQGDFARMRAIE